VVAAVVFGIIILLFTALALNLETQIMMLQSAACIFACFLFSRTSTSEAFSVLPPQSPSSILTTTRYSTQIHAISRGRRQDQQVRSKRQERVGHLVQTELSRIIHSGNVKGRDVTYLDDDVRQRVSVVRADVSPDLRQARISVSIRDGGARDGSGRGAVDKRRAYSWLVDNTKAIRHTLAQRLSHMKSCPNLTFVQVDVSAAVDVMYLIDKVSSSQGYKRDQIEDEAFPFRDENGVDVRAAREEDDMEPSEDRRAGQSRGVVGELDYGEEIGEDDWIDEDDAFFG